LYNEFALLSQKYQEVRFVGWCLGEFWWGSDGIFYFGQWVLRDWEEFKYNTQEENWKIYQKCGFN